MDLARSIDFNRLDDPGYHAVSPPSLPKKSFGIDVNREFDMYTTDTVPDPAEAPPVYQQDQTTDPSWPSNHSDCPKFVLRTRNHSGGSLLGNPAETTRPASQPKKPLQAPAIQPATSHSERPLEALAQNAIQQQPVLPETTVLCELWAPFISSTTGYESMPGRRGLTKGASTCILRITVTEKSSAGKGSRAVRSIWTIAQDGKLCIRQKLPQRPDTIPYTLWGNETRVVIRQPTELRYHKDVNSVSPYTTIETSWVTYTFDSASQSSDFQSTILSPLQLVRSFPTTRTMRLHPSPFIRAFSPKLQLCGLENLRIFHDATDPHCLVCLIHYSPNFRPSNGEEYIIFRLYPPPRNSVRIREDGKSCVKIKGLDIRGSPAGEQAKKVKSPQSQSELMEEEAFGSQSIEKMKIEFESGKEKREFLGMTRELQGMSSW
ncbi:MAG: hypothetical protein Q9169_004998 [Polycauliona sp. 2 TL-2023]